MIPVSTIPVSTIPISANVGSTNRFFGVSDKAALCMTYFLSVSKLLVSTNVGCYEVTFGSLAVPRCWIVRIGPNYSRHPHFYILYSPIHTSIFCNPYPHFYIPYSSIHTSTFCTPPSTLLHSVLSLPHFYILYSSIHTSTFCTPHPHSYILYPHIHTSTFCTPHPHVYIMYSHIHTSIF